VRGALTAVRMAALALVACAVLLLVSGQSPYHVFLAILRGAFATKADLARTLAGATPLLLAGVAVAIPFRAGLFNIGAEGQLTLAGLLCGILCAKLTGLPPVLLLALAVLAPVLLGAFWAALAGLMRARFHVHEVIATILLNFIAWSLVAYVLRIDAFGLMDGMEPKTEEVPSGVRLPALLPGGVLGLGFVAAAALALLADWLLFRSRPGLALRALGGNPRAAEAVGVRSSRMIVAAMAVGGGFAALAGVQQVLEVHGSYIEGFSPGYGFTAIAVALLGGTRPAGVILAALFFSVLRSGAFAMDALAGLPREAVHLLEAIVILLVASERLREAFRSRRRRAVPRGGAA